MKQNKVLKEIYDSVYQKDEKDHYTKFRLQAGDLPEEYTAALNLLDWTNKDVIDAGCGTGDMCALVQKAGAASVTGIDYSSEAIAEANTKYQEDNLLFEVKKIEEIDSTYDVFMSFGTLEHMDDPLATLRQWKAMLRPEGSLILTCPNWTNPRGYILQTLWRLFDAPITLADIHYLTPLDFINWSSELDMELDWCTVDYEWGGGEKMVKDLERRLPNIAKDAGWNISKEKLDSFLQWLNSKSVPFKGDRKHEGAVGVYHFKTSALPKD